MAVNKATDAPNQPEFGLPASSKGYVPGCNTLRSDEQMLAGVDPAVTVQFVGGYRNDGKSEALKHSLSQKRESNFASTIEVDDIAANSGSHSAFAIAKNCSCPVCLCVGIKKHNVRGEWKNPCRVLGCNEPRWYWVVTKHEKSHFIEAGKYACLEEDCHTTVAKWGDLKRHYKSRHCTRTTKYPCLVIGCKYGGANGFPRKDKLKSHFKNVHAGKGHGTLGQGFGQMGPTASRGCASGHQD